MNKRHERTLITIFKTPPSANVLWGDFEKLLATLGAEISSWEGSRVRILLNGVKAVFHRPHPRKEIDKGALVSLRRFLENAGIRPKEEK